MVTQLAQRVKKHVTLDPAIVSDLEELAARKGGESSLSRELNRAAREYIKRQKSQQDDSILAPVLEQLLEEKFAQLEAWLRPGVWGGATYSTTASLLLLELLMGQTVEPEKAKEHLDLIRGRAWKMVRKGPQEAESGQAG